jgi:hypothetical protein
MISRLAPVFAVLLLVVTPTVRAICDVSCVTIPWSSGAPAPASSHCGSHPEDNSSVPGPDDGCGHGHPAWESILAATGKTVAPPEITGFRTSGIIELRWVSERVMTAIGLPPDTRHPSSVPLRI